MKKRDTVRTISRAQDVLVSLGRHLCSTPPPHQPFSWTFSENFPLHSARIARFAIVTTHVFLVPLPHGNLKCNSLPARAQGKEIN